MSTLSFETDTAIFWLENYRRTLCQTDKLSPMPSQECLICKKLAEKIVRIQQGMADFSCLSKSDLSLLNYLWSEYAIEEPSMLACISRQLRIQFSPQPSLS